MNKSISFQSVLQAKRISTDLVKQFWFQHSFLTWQWWFLLGIAFLPWIFWYLWVADKRRLFELLTFAAFLDGCSLLFDTIGINEGAWFYPIQLYWSFDPPLVPVDITAIPVLFVIIYQLCERWLPFLLTTTLAALVSSFVFEPFFVNIGIYKLFYWKYIYSFPIYIMMVMTARAFTLFVKQKIQAQSRTN